MESITSDRKITCPKCGAENLSWRSNCDRCGEKLHKNEVLPKFERRGAGFWIAFVSGSIGLAVLVMLVLLAAGLSGYFSIDLILLLAFPILGLALCWKWPRIAAVLLIIGGLIPIIIVLVSGAGGDVMGYLLLLIGIALPLASSGVIFFILGRGD
jgi:hypothetical protein